MSYQSYGHSLKRKMTCSNNLYPGLKKLKCENGDYELSDEWFDFGSEVSSRLKGLKTHVSKCYAKSNIYKVLSEAERLDQSVEPSAPPLLRDESDDESVKSDTTLSTVRADDIYAKQNTGLAPWNPRSSRDDISSPSASLTEDDNNLPLICRIT